MNRAVSYSRHGDPSVLEYGTHPVGEPGDDEIRVRVLVSGVNPTDTKTRRGDYGGGPPGRTVVHHDGAGIVDAVGPAVIDVRPGDRVWVTLAGSKRPASGTAQDYTVVPAERVFPLPAVADFDLGASIGIPACTAHRALTVAEDGPSSLGPDALKDTTVLVAGGAGAVGNAAIQLARWSDARVLATVSGIEKAALATAAGAHQVINYKHPDAAQQIRAAAPAGVDMVVEVAAGANAALDLDVLRPGGTIAIYGAEGGVPFAPDVPRSMGLNARYQFVLLYTVGWDRIADAADDVNRCITAGAFGIGEAHGLPVHRFMLQETADAQRAVEAATTGKVLVTLDR
jgi:NADPH2:quinone reductase